MDERWQRLLDEHGVWLRSVRWVSAGEYALCWLVPVCSLLAGAAGWHVSGWRTSLAAGAGHLLLGLDAAIAVSRRGAWMALAFVALSALNYALSITQVAAASPSAQGMHYVAVAILAAGMLLAGLSLTSLRSQGRRWHALLKASTRDDFRWALTTAPLLFRWRVTARLNADGAKPPLAGK